MPSIRINDLRVLHKMDPLSQAVVGATASQTVSNRNDLVAASLLGFFSGMAADLDIFIRSADDPLLFLEYHRQFSHSLIFMPIGGLICACIFWLLIQTFSKNKHLGFGRVYLYSFVGYATHGLLDACTSYGTQLFWPFSSERVAWNNVSIIDPVFTLPLLLIVATAMFQRSRKLAITGTCYALLYLSLGLVQEHRAHDAAQTLAASRGHQAINLNVKPSFMNLIVWKSIYEYQGKYYVDAIRIVKQASIFEGASTDKLDLKRDFPWLHNPSQQALDVKRFRWFSNQHLAVDPNNPNRIIDMRYSMLPNKLDGLWGIELSRSASQTDHIKWTANRGRADRQNNIDQLWAMVLGKDASELAY